MQEKGPENIAGKKANNPAKKQAGKSTVADKQLQQSPEQLLSLYEARLRMAIEATKLGTWDYQPLTEALFWSKECRRVYGVSDDQEIDFIFFRDHIHPDDRDAVLSAFAGAMDPDGTGNYDKQYRILHYPDNKVKWIRSQGKVYFNQDRQAELFIGTVLDITGQKIKEQDLANSITLFREMADTVPAIIWIADEQGNFTYVNEQWSEFTGLSYIDSLATGWKSVLFPDDATTALEKYLKALNGRNAFQLTTRIRHATGEQLWCIFSARPKFDTNSNFEGFIGSIVNIHEQKLAEVGAQRLAAIVHSSNDGIISKTLAGIITSWNPAAERLFGYTADEIIGQHITVLIPKERINEEQEIISRIAIGEIVRPFDTKRVNKAGKHIDISLTISPIRDKDGTIIGASKIARDITLQKALNDALHKSESKFRELVMQAPIGITILRGRDYLIEMVNAAYLNIVDYEEDKFIGQKLFDVLPLMKDSIGPLLNQIMTTGEPYFGEEYPVQLKRFGRIDNAFFNFVYQPLMENGVINGIIVIANEVTRQVEIKHSLAESFKEFRKMVTQSPIPMTIFRGPDFIIEIANNAMMKDIWRKEETEVIGKRALDIFPELKEQKYYGLMQEVYKSGYSHREKESIAFVQGNDGIKKFYLDFEYAPLFDADGCTSGMMITVNDVTEKVEARLKVEDAEERLRMAVDGTGLATWDLNLQTGALIYSPRLAEIFGHSPEEITLTQETMRAQIHPVDLKNSVEKAYDTAVKTGIYDYEARVIWPDGSLRWIKTQGKLNYDDHKKPVRMLGTVKDITEQKKTQEAIAESENRLTIAVEAAELGTWELNMLTDTRTYSKRYLQILGFTQNDHPDNEAILAKILPEDLPHRQVRMKEAVKTGILDLEMRIIPGKDRKIHWIRARGKVFYDEKNHPIRMLGTIMDVTEQKNSMQIISESEERFKTIANTAPVMIWMSGTDKFSDFFNTSWLNFTGRKQEEEIGDGWLQNVHPDDVKPCIEMYDASLQQHTPFHIEYRLKRADGKYRWIADNAVPRYDAAGNFIGFISACMDIDDEKRFNQRLQASELLFKTITNVAPVGLWMTDEKGNNNFVNDTWSKWTGTGIRGSSSDGGWVESLLEADKGIVLRHFQSRFANREKFSTEFRFKLSDGSVRWGQSEGFPYYDTEGEFAGYAGSVTDITERKQDELRKNEFLAVASHELKTPITSIKAYTQLLANTYEKTDDNFLKNALGKVENQVNKMSKMVSDFLNLSKIESDRFQLMKEPFCINDLVTEIVSDTQLVTSSHRINIQESERVAVEADREKIAQVVTNLLNNAVKYSPNEKEVLVYIKRKDGQVTVSIRDFGIGIRADEHDKIFERFYRAGPNNIQFSGFGIGLYISAEIIRKHGGDIGLTETTDKGSCFYFKLAALK